jgi:hypothetical protein
MVEAQYIPQEVQAKIIASTTNNLPNQPDQASAEFDKRVRIAELMLKEADIKNKSKIVELQMSNAKSNVADMENQFLQNLNQELSNGNR